MAGLSERSDTMAATNVHQSGLAGAGLFVLLGDPRRLAPEAWAEALTNRLGEGARASPSGDTGNLLIEIDGAPHIAFTIDHAVPATEFTDGFGAQADGDGFREAVESHRAHLVLSPLAAPASMAAAVGGALRLLDMAVTVPADCQPVGVFWLPSGRLVPLHVAGLIADGAREAAAAVERGATGLARELPVGFWVRIQLAGGDGLVAGRTRGLASFTGFELDLPVSTRTPQAAHDLLASLVGYLFDQGPVFAPGQRLDIGNGEVLTLAAVPAAEGAPPLMVLRDGGGLQ